VFPEGPGVRLGGHHSFGEVGGGFGGFACHGLRGVLLGGASRPVVLCLATGSIIGGTWVGMQGAGLRRREECGVHPDGVS
jgi:hypothetical protein